MDKFVYLVVWGDFCEHNRNINVDKFTQYAFDSLEKAQRYVAACLLQSARELDDYTNVVCESDVKVDKTYECFSNKLDLGYDYIRIRQYYLM